MKILRVTQYALGNEPMTVVVREPDLTMPPEEVGRPDTPGTFYVQDLFEVPDDPSIYAATVEAMGRVKRGEEDNMAIYYYWTAMQFRIVISGGLIANPDPTPISAEQVQVCMRQLAEHPAYDQHTVVSPTHDGKLVELRRGNVTVRDL